MAENNHGGYRKPSNPAPVSGPGKYSKRTDGHPSQVKSAAPDQGYGEKKEQLDSQSLAPMGAAQPTPEPAHPAQGDAPAESMPAFGGGEFGGPSSRPDEPITHGVDVGAGGGPSALGLGAPQVPTGYITNMLQTMSATDTTGTLAQLYEIARQRGV